MPEYKGRRKMGHFLTVTAFKSDNTDRIVNSILEYTSEFDVNSRIAESVDEPCDQRHAVVYESVDGWCVVVWPSHFFGFEAPLAQALSATLDTVISTISVYDGDYWSHKFFSSGVQLDNFCSMPTYWCDSDDDTELIISEFRGSPCFVAENLNIDESTIQGYYLPILEDKDYPKVVPGDKFGLDDFWVFTDFWDKLNIQYPANGMSYYKVVDLTRTFSKKLPEVGV